MVGLILLAAVRYKKNREQMSLRNIPDLIALDHHKNRVAIEFECEQKGGGRKNAVITKHVLAIFSMANLGSRPLCLWWSVQASDSP